MHLREYVSMFVVVCVFVNVCMQISRDLSCTYLISYTHTPRSAVRCLFPR